MKDALGRVNAAPQVGGTNCLQLCVQLIWQVPLQEGQKASSLYSGGLQDSNPIHAQRWQPSILASDIKLQWNSAFELCQGIMNQVPPNQQDTAERKNA